jgi:hypothetical protein
MGVGMAKLPALSYIRLDGSAHIRFHWGYGKNKNLNGLWLETGQVKEGPVSIFLPINSLPSGQQLKVILYRLYFV